MEYLIVLYDNGKIQTALLKNEKGFGITIGCGENDTLKLSSISENFITLRPLNEGVHLLSRGFVVINGEQVFNQILSAGDTVNIRDKVTLAIFESKCEFNGGLSLSDIHEISIGRSSRNNICLKGEQVSSSHAVIKRNGNKFFIHDRNSSNGTFINGQLINSEPVQLKDEAKIFIGGYIFIFDNKILRVMNSPEDIIFSQDIIHSLVNIPEKRKIHNTFYRSPRIRASGMTSEVEISQPPSSGSKPAVSWLSVILPPAMMIIVMLSVASFTRNVTTLFYTLPMSSVSIIVAIINYRSQVKKWKQTQDLIRVKYSEHLAEKEREIIHDETAYISTLASINPGIHECLSIAENVKRRLWERTPSDSDFLNVRLGTGQEISNVLVKVPKEKLTLEEDPFLREAENLRHHHEILHGVPVCHSFVEMPITGLVGTRGEVQKVAWEIIMGVAVHHSYEDVKIICVYPESERSKWECIRWLPHVWNSERTRRYLACTPDKASVMLRELAETLKVRRRESSEHRGEILPDIPFYFLVLADKSLVEASGEMFLPESSALGFAALYAYGDMNLLPGECQAVIECGNSDNMRTGFVQLTSDAEAQKIFMPDRISLSLMNNFARALAPIRLHTSGSSAGMPSYIPFLQGLGVSRVEELNVMNRWEKGQPFKSIAAPIGIKENGEIFYFDIHEKGMGPHGIAAGATRWGKSETLTTWLLSVALHYKPEEVSFVLIDFKGDGLSGILMDLPHVAGVISNVDDITSIERNLRSLRGELIRRQRVFKDTKLENIHRYQETRRKNNTNLDPMPYLIVVIDEFAELKTQFPEQMDEFISIARVGGSLGVYMVLATQSPGGIVAGQVSANSRFRICLKTSEAGESKEILGTTDAFRITVRGRAYVKVGNNEVYEQVQTFYSKATYRPDLNDKGPAREINIVEINGERIRPEIYDKTVGASGADLGEGRAISAYIRSEAEKYNMPFAKPVWTDALPKRLALSELISGHEAFANNSWSEINQGLSVTVGRIDDPEEQCQYPFVMDFMKDGHQILYGAPSSGKTTFLQTVLLSAALCYTPEQVQFLILDYGNWGLKIFESLPHVLMSGDPNDDEKINKAKDFISNEINLRKKLFAAQGVGTLEAYRDVSGKKLPAIIVVVDNMASLYNQSPDLMDILIQTAREGGGLGIYLALTAGNPGSFMFRIAQYVKSNHALQLTDRSDYRQLVGGTGRQEPQHFPGRGFTRGPLEFQTALCVDAPNEGERIKLLRDICSAMSSTWSGKRASLDEAEHTDIDAEEMSLTQDGFEIGISKSSREPVEFVFSEMNGCIISGPEGSGKSNLLGLIVNAASQDLNTKVYIYERKTFLENLSMASITAHTPQDADEIISELADEFDNRIDFGQIYDRIVFCIDDFPEFYRGISQQSADILDTLTRSGGERGIYIYIVCSPDGLSSMHIFRINAFENCLMSGNAALTGGKLGDYTAFNDIHRNIELTFSDHEGCLIHDGEITTLRFAKLEACYGNS